MNWSIFETLNHKIRDGPCPHMNALVGYDDGGDKYIKEDEETEKEEKEEKEFYETFARFGNNQILEDNNLLLTDPIGTNFKNDHVFKTLRDVGRIPTDIITIIIFEYMKYIRILPIEIYHPDYTPNCNRVNSYNKCNSCGDTTDNIFGCWTCNDNYCVDCRWNCDFCGNIKTCNSCGKITLYKSFFACGRCVNDEDELNRIIAKNTINELILS